MDRRLFAISGLCDLLLGAGSVEASVGQGLDDVSSQRRHFAVFRAPPRVAPTLEHLPGGST